MSRPELSLFSYEILGLVGRLGAGPHDLKQMTQRGRMLDWAGESQYYAEPKRLAKLGYLEARKEPGKTRERTVYALTEKGLEALACVGEDAGHVHASQERDADANADRRPRRRGADTGEHPHAARRHRRPRRAARREPRRAQATRAPLASTYCCRTRSCGGCSTSTSNGSTRWNASSPRPTERTPSPPLGRKTRDALLQGCRTLAVVQCEQDRAGGARARPRRGHLPIRARSPERRRGSPG